MFQLIVNEFDWNKWSARSLTLQILIRIIQTDSDQRSHKSSDEKVEYQPFEGILLSSEISALKRGSTESATQTPTNEFPKQESTVTYGSNRLSATTHSMPTNGYPYGGLYNCYPMDSPLVYSSYPPMYSMQPNFGPTPPMPSMISNYGPMPQMVNNYGTPPMMSNNGRQCPYCLAPNASVPANTSYVNAFQMAAKSSRMPDPIAVHTVTVPPPQWTHSQIGSTSSNSHIEGTISSAESGSKSGQI